MRKTERRRAAETQSEELNFAPLQLGDSALNASAPPPAPKGRKTLAQGNALGPVAEDAPSAERAQEAELPVGWQFIPFTETICAARARVVKVQQSNYRESGRFPIIDQGQEFIAGYWDGEDDVYRDGLPVIVFGDHTRIFKFVDFPFVAGADGTHVLVPDRSRFEPFFLYLALSSLDIPSRGYNRHFRLLKERSIVTPPLPEQRAIAAVLRTVQWGEGGVRAGAGRHAPTQAEPPPPPLHLRPRPLPPSCPRPPQGDGDWPDAGALGRSCNWLGRRQAQLPSDEIFRRDG